MLVKWLYLLWIKKWLIRWPTTGQPKIGNAAIRFAIAHGTLDQIRKCRLVKQLETTFHGSHPNFHHLDLGEL